MISLSNAIPNEALKGGISFSYQNIFVQIIFSKIGRNKIIKLFRY